MTAPGNVFEAISNYRADVKTRQANVQEATGTTANRYQRRPAWYSPLPISDVSYPHALNLQWPVFGQTGAASAGTAHTHQIDTNNTSAIIGNWSIGTNISLGGYIPITQNAQFTYFGVYVHSDTALAGGTVPMSVLREEEDGSLTQIVSVDLAPYITTTSQPLGTTISGGLIVRDGERYLVRVANKASPTRTVRITGIATTTQGPADMAFQTSNSTETNRTNFTAAQAATSRGNGTLIVWAVGGAVDPPQEDRTWVDDFNRANLGPSWSWDSIALGATSEFAISGGRLVYTGADGFAEAKFVNPVLGDAMRLDADLHEVNDPDAGTTLWITADRENTSAVGVEITSDSAIIQSVVGGSTVDRATVATTGNDVTWSIYYDEDENTYVVLKNGEDIGLSWEDTGNIIPHGANQRYAVISMDQISGVSGSELDNFVFRDWRP